VTDNWGSELRLEVPLYQGGARRAAVEAAGFGVRAAERDAAALRGSLELAVARAYFEVQGARETVVAAEAALASQAANLELAEKRFAERAELRSAVLDFRAKVAEAEADLVVARNARDLAVEYLRVLVGIEAGEDGVSFVVSDRAEAVPPPGDASGPRAELEAAALRVGQAGAGVKLARAARMPEVSAFASGRYDEGFADPGGGGSWMAGLSVRLNVWDGGEAESVAAAAEARRAAAEEAARKQRLEITHQSRRAGLDLAAARQRIALADDAIASASESLGLTRDRFAQGLALSTQLIEAERALTAARVGLATARADEQAALAALRHARGLPVSGAGPAITNK
jgi:outer membrane protein TolC